jgi:adenosylmethionine-8-amino-7-oxononanoate aminotransferase
VDGTAGDHILLAPPYTISDDQIGFIIENLHLAIDAAIGA